MGTDPGFSIRVRKKEVEQISEVVTYKLSKEEIEKMYGDIKNDTNVGGIKANTYRRYIKYVLRESKTKTGTKIARRYRYNFNGKLYK